MGRSSKKGDRIHLKKQIMSYPTGELDRILERMSYENLDGYIGKYTFSDGEITVAEYLSALIVGKGLRKKTVISRSGVSENLGYKILNGTKVTTDRDKIIGLCIGAGLSVEQTNQALALAKLGALYSRNARDAVIIVGLNGGITNVMDINEQLEMRSLRLLNLHEKR